MPLISFQDGIAVHRVSSNSSDINIRRTYTRQKSVIEPVKGRRKNVPPTKLLISRMGSFSSKKLFFVVPVFFLSLLVFLLFDGVINEAGHSTFNFRSANYTRNDVTNPSVDIDQKSGLKVKHYPDELHKIEIESEVLNWTEPFIHVINTRFMQNQGTLKTLAQARLHLFETFCLPTMIHQTSQSFLWIIKTDKDLDIFVREKMVELLAPYENYFLIGSHANFLIGHDSGAWRGGVESEEIWNNVKKGFVYTGNIDLLRSAMFYSDEKIILETRLDADDGLHTSFLSHVQKTAVLKFTIKENRKVNDSKVSFGPAKWRYWCVKHYIEWFSNQNEDEGSLNAISHSNFCVTPGITLGFNIGTAYEDVPHYDHSHLFASVTAKTSKGCGLRKTIDCLGMDNIIMLGAIRSRTPTSAGMKEVNLEHTVFPHNKMLSYIQRGPYKISLNKMREANTYIQKNMLHIAIENLKGQCTEGHSCKISSMEQLQRLVDIKTVRNTFKGEYTESVDFDKDGNQLTMSNSREKL